MILPLPGASHLSSSELPDKTCTQTMSSLPEMQHRLERGCPLKQEWMLHTVRTGRAVLLPGSAAGEEATAFCFSKHFDCFPSAQSAGICLDRNTTLFEQGKNGNTTMMAWFNTDLEKLSVSEL